MCPASFLLNTHCNYKASSRSIPASFNPLCAYATTAVLQRSTCLPKLGSEATPLLERQEAGPFQPRKGGRRGLPSGGEGGREGGKEGYVIKEISVFSPSKRRELVKRKRREEKGREGDREGGVWWSYPECIECPHALFPLFVLLFWGGRGGAREGARVRYVSVVNERKEEERREGGRKGGREGRTYLVAELCVFPLGVPEV